jgi:hypothetical protein
MEWWHETRGGSIARGGDIKLTTRRMVLLPGRFIWRVEDEDGNRLDGGIEDSRELAELAAEYFLNSR